MRLQGASTMPCSSNRQVWGSSCKEGAQEGQRGHGQEGGCADQGPPFTHPHTFSSCSSATVSSSLSTLLLSTRECSPPAFPLGPLDTPRHSNPSHTPPHL